MQNDKSKFKNIFFLLFIVVFLFYGAKTFGGFSEVMNSTNYKISPDSINVGGGDDQTSTNYRMKDTAGESGTGTSDTSSYSLKAGYRQTTDVAAVSTTTTTAEAGGPGPKPDTTAPNVLKLLISKIAADSEKISWETNEQALCKFYLGKTESYEMEYFEEPTFYYQHERKFTGLEPGKTYHFKISCKDTNYNSAESPDYSFIFAAELEAKPIPDVSSLDSEIEEKKIILKWDNPDFTNFEKVKIVRSEEFYPQNPEDGKVVYEGKDNTFTDDDVETGKRYYYTIFTYDKEGNRSSGAVITDVPRKPGTPAPPLPEIPSEIPLPPELEKLTIKDFDFFLGEKRIFPSLQGEIYASPKKPLTFFLQYEKVPEVLKTIIVALRDGDKFFSFLLRVNKEKTGFEATLMSPSDSGIYPLSISIMDYKNKLLKKIAGELKVEANIYKTTQGYWEQGRVRPYIYILIGMGLVAIPLLIARKRKRKRIARAGVAMADSQGAAKKEEIPLLESPKMIDMEGKERKDFPNFKINK